MNRKGVIGIMLVFMLALVSFVIYYFVTKNIILDFTNSVALKFVTKVNQTMPEYSQVNPDFVQEIISRENLSLILLFFVPITLLTIWAIIWVYIVRVRE